MSVQFFLAAKKLGLWLLQMINLRSFVDSLSSNGRSKIESDVSGG